MLMQPNQSDNKFRIRILSPSRRRVKAAIVFLVIAACFGALRLAAMGIIDTDRWIGGCGFKQRYDLPCPTCAMTTSAVTFAQGKIFKAFYIQPAAALFCSVLAAAAFLALLTAVFGVNFKFVERFLNDVKIRHIVFALLIIIVAGWVVTLARALNNR